MIGIIWRFLLFLLIYGVVCLSYYVSLICYENGRPFVVTVIMLVMSSAVSITIMILIGRLQ